MSCKESVLMFNIVNYAMIQEATERPDLYGIRRSGRQRKEVSRLSIGNVNNFSCIHLWNIHFSGKCVLSVLR